MQKIFVLFVFCCGALFGLENVPFEEVAYGGEPTGLVGGCVSVISGDYVVREVDWVVQGHEPIAIERRHLSSRSKGDKWAGWEFFFNHLKAPFYVVEESVDAVDPEKPVYETVQVVIPEKYGFSLAYEVTYLKGNPDGELKLKGEYPHALTNCHTGEVGGRYGAFNNNVYFDPKEHRVIKVNGSDGSVRAYQRLDRYEESYHLRWERLPNGNKVHYQWNQVDGVWRLKRVATTDGTVKKTYAWMEIEYVMHGKWLDRIEIKTSDSQHIVYDIANKKGVRQTFWALEKVGNSGRPGQKYDYWGNKDTSYFVSDRFFPEGRRLRIDYYLKGDNPLSQQNIVIKKQKDKKVMRVKRLRLSLLEGGGLQSIFEFYYHPGSYHRKGGYTDVVDPYGNSTRYAYNSKFLLTGVDHREKGKGVFAKERFEWSEYDPKKGHWLKEKILKDAQGVALRRIRYHYDHKGNVEKEKLVGDLTGAGNNLECYVVKRRYNRANLVTEERFPNGKVIEYLYVPDTNLIHAKLIRDQEKIKIRHGFTYNGTVLKRKIIDDGATRDLQNLTGVTQRIIMDIHPKSEGLFLDFPEVIEEKYLDLASGRECLLGRQKLEYHSNGKPTTVVYFDAEGKERYSIHRFYDERGRLSREIDPLGREKRYCYDANDNLIGDHHPDREYEVLQGFDYVNRLLSRTEGDRQTRYVYDFLGRKLTDVHFRGESTWIDYDPFGHPTTTRKPVVKNHFGEIKQPVVNEIYNALDRVSREEDAEGNVTQKDYTCRGKPSRIIHPDGVEEHFRYNLEGEVTVHIKAGGAKTVYRRDFLNRVVCKEIYAASGEPLSSERYSFDAFHMVKKTSPDGVITTYEYDGAGRKCLEQTLDRVKTIRYDSLGREEAIIEGGVRVFKKKYDLLNRLLEEREADIEGNVYSTVRSTYDDYSNKVASVKEVQVGEAVERTEYDPFKREVKKTDPLGHTTETIYDDYFINSLGQKVLKKISINPLGTKTVEEYDALDRIVKIEKIAPNGTILLMEEFFYDLNGRKRRQESTLDAGQKIIKVWEYDRRGRVVKLIEGFGTTSEKVTKYAYTLDGEKSVVTKPDGVVINFIYDGLGRQTSIRTSDESCYYILKYDAMSRITESYDQVNQLKTTRKYDHFGKLLHESLANGFSLNQHYDYLGRKKRIIFSDGSRVSYHYDPFHMIAVEREDSEGNAVYQHEYNDYDQSHNLLRETLLKDVGEAFHQVDLRGRRIHSETDYSIEQIPLIDPNGNVREYYRFAENSEELSTFDYDFLDQLSSESGLFNHTYIHDSHHNRLQKDTSNYQNDVLHQLISTTESVYNHDENGNRTLWKTEESEVTYTYDGLDRLSQVRSGDKAICFSYDSWGRCLLQTHLVLEESTWNTVKTTPFLYDDQKELGAYPNELRILGQGKGAEIGAAIAIEKNGRVYSPIHDLFGNIIALLNPDGQCVESYRFSSFGEESIPKSPLVSWRYQSKRKVTHLVNFGRRFYDPPTGRWISPDPKGFDEGPNLYQYLFNSPYLNCDLYGEMMERDADKLASRIVHRPSLEKDMGPPYSCNVEYTPQMGMSELNEPSDEKSKLGIGMVCGIATDHGRMEELMAYASSIAGGLRVEGTFSPTKGLATDIRRANISLNLVATETSYLILERWTKFFENNASDALYLELPHSRGCIDAELALIMAPKEIRERIIIVAIAPAKFISSAFCKDAFNYVTTHDVVPKLQKVLAFAKAPDPTVVNLDESSPIPKGAHGFDEEIYNNSIERHISELLGKSYD